MSTFFIILTEAGEAAFANAGATGTKVDIKEMALGDGSAAPIKTQTQLQNEVYRAQINEVKIDSENDNWIVATLVVPATEGGFTIREAGLFDTSGTLLAVGNYPDTYKPILAEGSTKDLVIQMVMEVTSAESVTLKIDPAVVLASRQYVDHKVLSTLYNGLDLDDPERGLTAAAGKALKDSLSTTQDDLGDIGTITIGSSVIDGLNKVNDRHLDLFPDNAGGHNGIFRGKSLGSTVTSTQKTNITNGTFKDMYIGDYWTINGVNWRIAAFNYYRGKGDTATSVNHVTLVPDTVLYNHVMNDSNITTGGYIGSKIYSEGLDSAISTIDNAFPGMVLSVRRHLSNAVTEGKPTAGAWESRKVDLMTETMVYGSVINGAVDTHGVFNVGTEHTQLPLFMFRPDLICNKYNWWLRDVCSASRFAFVNNGGYATRLYASHSRGVRPAFSIS